MVVLLIWRQGSMSEFSGGCEEEGLSWQNGNYPEWVFFYPLSDTCRLWIYTAKLLSGGEIHSFMSGSCQRMDIELEMHDVDCPDVVVCGQGTPVGIDTCQDWSQGPALLPCVPPLGQTLWRREFLDDSFKCNPHPKVDVKYSLCVPRAMQKDCSTIDLVTLNNKNVLFHNSGGYKSKIKMRPGSVPYRDCGRICSLPLS